MQRCFQLRYSGSNGTAFLHSVKDKVAFVTAAHVIKNSCIGDSFWFRQETGWVAFEVNELIFDLLQDIAVFTLKNFFVSGPWTEPEIVMGVAHPLIYLGFPHALFGNYPSQGAIATPLAKVAYFSGHITINGVKLMLLDGLNNPGFSGSPIFHRPIGHKSDVAALVGLVHGYRYETDGLGSVFRRTGPDGTTKEKTKDLFVRLNSGIITASARDYIENLYDKLTDGLEIYAT